MEIIEEIMADRRSRDTEHSPESRTNKGDHAEREEGELMNSNPEDQEEVHIIRLIEWGDSQDIRERTRERALKGTEERTNRDFENLCG